MLLDRWRECVQRREGNRDTHTGKGQRRLRYSSPFPLSRRETVATLIC